ncbi:MAG: c-type cytochrome [Gemmataceae bacterium]|nr:c-type cytochrome [Gemmataceae bacterium]
MFRRFLLPALALALLAIFSINTIAQKKKAPPATSNDAVHDPAVAVKNLDVHPDLQASLFTSEPKITNPVNLDIDHRGRVWICDIVNYRGNNGKRPAGDRILILDDTDGDGVADKVTTFYQGRDIDSAMGVCVLGNKVIVSAPANIIVFTKDDNDKVINKEFLFTKTGNAQHDHSSHSFVFGPDGRLYWNFGNTGGAVHDKNGKPVVDLAGNVVNDKAKPYRQGMVFRCEMDGSNFEVLGHNFRNNFEVAVDSFGTLWQSDNDDDGNRGVRINFVMEYGNYGYVDEMTGAGWQKPRTNMEKEIPLKHWHLNDPGVVPNLLQTYQGSPTGICVYEGNLLPKVFQNQMIHCDAGPSIVRAYPVTTDGAGYKASIVNILDGAKKNNWFRPADVCTAPDGSIFVTDWYDPGVGGHAQRDSDRGRIFRVAPPGVKYSVPKVNFDTIEGNIEALKSPNLATRYIAWTNLNKAGKKAEDALIGLYVKSKVPQEQARALWLLAQIPDNAESTVTLAFRNEDPNLRIVGLRIARQHKLDPLPWVAAGVFDQDAAVRRECAIALRHSKSPKAPDAWANLAGLTGSSGTLDRWYLEALGIGADRNWDAYLDAYLKMRKAKSFPDFPLAYREVIWRSRASKTPQLLSEIITLDKTPGDELPRYFRAFDFQKDSDIKTEALVKLAFGVYEDPARRKLITTEAISRLKNFDIKNPKYAVAVNKLLDQSLNTPLYVELVGKFNLADRYGSLLAIAQNQPSEQLGIDAMTLLLERNAKLALPGLTHKQIAAALATVQAMGNSAHVNGNSLLLPIVQDAKADLELRRQATRALARNQPGARELLKLAQSKQLAKELEIAAGSVLSLSSAKDIREQAAKLFPQPTTKDKKPLSAISELVKSKGNATNGAIVFAKQGTCAKCHQINGEHKNVGPDLSEIGKKLAREALFESILYPSAGIAHSFETWVVETKKGTNASGLLVSKTPDEVSIKDAESIVRTFKMAEVESLTKSAISLMPADLHQSMTTQELSDVVEYLVTLREARKK